MTRNMLVKVSTGNKQKGKNKATKLPFHYSSSYLQTLLHNIFPSRHPSSLDNVSKIPYQVSNEADNKAFLQLKRLKVKKYRYINGVDVMAMAGEVTQQSPTPIWSMMNRN